jgi:hypothetical protein
MGSPLQAEGNATTGGGAQYILPAEHTGVATYVLPATGTLAGPPALPRVPRTDGGVSAAQAPSSRTMLTSDTADVTSFDMHRHARAKLWL